MEIINRICVQHFDENDRALGPPECFDLHDPEGVSADGCAQIEKYVFRLINSTAPRASLGVFTPGGLEGVGVNKHDGSLSLFLSADVETELGQVAAIRQYFAECGLECIDDYLAANGGVPDSTRLMTYSLPSDAVLVAQIIKDILRGIYGVPEQSGLDFDYEEFPAAS